MARCVVPLNSLPLQSQQIGWVHNATYEDLRFVGGNHVYHRYKRYQSLKLDGKSVHGKPEICCGLRGGPRGPMWRSRVLSTEAIQAVHSLKLAKSSPCKLEEAFNSKLTRLLKTDLIDALKELQRQNELELALKVFEFVRNELWYKPDLSLYCDMIFMFGKNKMVETSEELFFQLKKECLKPDTRTYTEMIGAFLQVGMVEKAMDTYRTMKESGCIPDKLTLTILIRNLEKAGEGELASGVKKDCVEYVDYPEKFLEEIGRKYPKRKSLELV